MIQDDLHTLDRDKEIMIKDLLMKVRRQDWHGVSDAANDLRELEIELKFAQKLQS